MESNYLRPNRFLCVCERTASLIVLALSVCVCDPVEAATPPQGNFTMAQTLSDGAQRTTLAFSGLAMMTGNLYSQTFFPPGKVADYTGFQYLRDNDPDNMGHNTSFLTRVANNVIYILNDTQFAALKTLAVSQMGQIDLYGYKRYPLMKAFRRLLEDDIPVGATGLDLDAIKAASKELYHLDGEISFDRALLYATVLGSFDTNQKAYLDAMKGKGWGSWPDITNDQIKTKMSGLPKGTAVAVMTYAGDLFSWYAGSIDADVYFCPERHGTYFGSFYIKDAPAIGHEGYSIDEQLTATAGAALCDSAKGYVTAQQASLMSSLVGTQRNNLYAGATNIVSIRTQISTLLRGLLLSTAASDSIKTQVLALSDTYGELDGENNYYYATVFSQVFHSLSADQKTKLAALRKSIMSGTYSDGTPFDFSVCTTPFLYSGVITDLSLLAPYIGDTDYLFETPAPVASYTYSPTAPVVGENVLFTDTSTHLPTSWSWDFGDGTTSAAQHPGHSFANPGPYTVTLTVANGHGATTNSQTITVSAVPSNAGTIQFAFTSYLVSERDGVVRVWVNRVGGSAGEASVGYATVNGSAIGGQDYSAASGTLTWSSGDANSKYFDVAILHDDQTEPSESFSIQLSGAVGASLGVSASALVTITNSDPSPTDVNDDGSTDAVDVQMVINHALGIGTGPLCDVNGDGKADAIDVQMVINGAMGLG